MRGIDLILNVFNRESNAEMLGKTRYFKYIVKVTHLLWKINYFYGYKSPPKDIQIMVMYMCWMHILKFIKHTWCQAWLTFKIIRAIMSSTNSQIIFKQTYFVFRKGCISYITTSFNLCDILLFFPITFYIIILDFPELVTKTMRNWQIEFLIQFKEFKRSFCVTENNLLFVPILYFVLCPHLTAMFKGYSLFLILCS